MLIFIGGGLSLKYSPDLQLNVLESYWTLKSRRELKIEKPFVKNFFLDSVPAYSPIVIKRGNIKWGEIDIIPIEELTQFKTLNKEVQKIENTYIYVNQTNLNRTWVKIKHIQRHSYKGNLQRINCHTGLIDTSPNHSLYNQQGKLIDAKKIKIGQKLLVCKKYKNRKLRHNWFIGNEDIAWLFGFFTAEGSSIQNKTNFCNFNEQLLDKCEKIIKNNFQVNSIKKCKDRIRIDNRLLAMWFREKFYTKLGFKKIPKEILNAPNNIQLAYFKGYYDGDGAKTIDGDFKSCTTNSQILATGLMWIGQQILNQRITITEEKKNNRNYYQINFSKSNKIDNRGLHNRISDNTVKENRKFYYKGFVYDIETEVGKFSTGIGQIIAKNSGAFSAWSRGATIDLDRYIGFVKRFKSQIDVYANLDNITNVQETEDNQKRMEDAGLNPLPVFHHGEPFKILDRLLNEYDYIALGGMVPIPTVRLDPWLTICFERICNKDGTAARKIHGFGLTTISLIKKYPFTSVDSVSPVLTGAMGGIMGVGGQVISLSRNKRIDEKTKLAIETLNTGFTRDELFNNYKARVLVNLRYFQQLEKELTENPPVFINKQSRLFDL